MACNFQGIKCEGAGHACEGAAQVYEVKVTQGQYLCDPCAAEKSHLIVTEKTGQPKWVCEKHKKDVEFFCETHGQEACSSCAMVSHQKPCELRDLGDVLADRKSEAAAVLVLAAEKKEEFTKLHKEFNLKKAKWEKYIGSNAGNIKAKWDMNKMHIEEKEEKLAIKINKKADEAIKKINDERNAQLRKLKKVADDQRDSIKKRQDKDLAEFAVHKKAVHDELKRGGSDLQQISWSLTENMAKLEISLEKENRETVTSIKQAVLATKESLEKEPHQTSIRNLVHKLSIDALTRGELSMPFGDIPWYIQFDYGSDSEWIKVVPFQQWYNEYWRNAAWAFPDAKINAVRMLKEVVDEHRDSIGSIYMAPLIH